MKSIILISLLVVLLSVSGCVPNLAKIFETTKTVPATQTEVAQTVTSVTPETTSPTFEQEAFPSVIEGDFWLAPAKINIGNLEAGDTIDTWQFDSVLDSGYSYKKGDPLCLFVYNNTDGDVVYDVSLDTEYLGQPVGFQSWITILTPSLSVAPKSVARLPFTIVVPTPLKGVSKNWEFRIDVVPQTKNPLVVAASARILIGMK